MKREREHSRKFERCEKEQIKTDTSYALAKAVLLPKVFNYTTKVYVR